jgi:uncharacterized protein (TIGR04255 family)
MPPFMTTRPPYPDFENPPVVEVALAVQFERLGGFRYTHFGLLWHRFAQAFPLVEDHPPIQTLVETFGVRESPRIGIQLVSGDMPPAVRSWFLTEPRNELLQIQPDKLVHNWRKVGSGVHEGTDYPRYEHIRKQFEDELAIFCEFVNDFQLGNFWPNQCEITYINHILPGEDCSTHTEIDKIISSFKPSIRKLHHLELENARFDMRYIIRNAEQRPSGRLHASLQPAFRKSDEKAIFVLTLTARGQPDEASTAGVMRFVDQGRTLIVHGFTELTTPEMHTVWGRRA